TSSMQSEGKSITATNLAISYAQQGKKVIIIDCDMRRPKLGRLIGVSSAVGLSNTLIQPELQAQAIHKVEKLGIDAILAGDIPPNPSELLGSGKMTRLLENLKGMYDLIILDTPPINMVTDAIVLAPKSDGVLFVVRANQSERGAVAFAVEQTEYAKAKILGFVLNGVDMENTAYGYSKYRYKRYHRYRKYGRYERGYGGYGYGHNSDAPVHTPVEDKEK
ncbi:MAG: CpsD/CapB family tyrosine-protein kinase, partial [Clostridia bacterium]|nr:CpsD/CapB family tyrosine-protein kinase [Clostridia bacterium]